LRTKRRWKPRRRAFWLAFALAIQSGAAMGRDQDPFAFFSEDVQFDASQRERLERDDVVVQVVRGDDDEIGVFAATKIDAGGDALAAWTRAITELKRSTVVLAIRRFSTPPALEDLNGMALDESDLQGILRCRPGDCSLKLAGEEIEALRTAAAHAGASWRTVIQHEFKRVMLDRVNSHVVESVDSESFFYWSKEQYGAGKRVISVTHVQITHPLGAGALEVLVLAKEVFATHYRTSSLGMTAIVHDVRIDQRYLAYLNRSHVDVLKGLFGGLKRKLIEGRLASDTAAFMRLARRRLESGDPPIPPAS
jgi:hypothetical protein